MHTSTHTFSYLFDLVSRIIHYTQPYNLPPSYNPIGKLLDLYILYITFIHISGVGIHNEGLLCNLYSTSQVLFHKDCAVNI